MSFLVGAVTPDQTSLLLIADGGAKLNLSQSYVYQRADIYLKVEFGPGAPVDLSNPAPGVITHAVFEQAGVPTFTLSSKSNRDKTLTLLP
jgi:hypothetical protein